MKQTLKRKKAAFKLLRLHLAVTLTLFIKLQRLHCNDGLEFSRGRWLCVMVHPVVFIELAAGLTTLSALWLRTKWVLSGLSAGAQVLSV